MSGYQGGVTDQSYAGQLNRLHVPMVGNQLRRLAEAMESDRIHARAAIMASLWGRQEDGDGRGRFERRPGWVARGLRVPAITDVDTRALDAATSATGATMKGGG